MAVLELIPDHVRANLQGDTEQEKAASLLQAIKSDPVVAANFSRVFDKITPETRYPVPMFPRIEAFAPRKGIPEGLSMTVSPSGEVEGRFFEWNVCVIGASRPGKCVTPFPSPDGYNAYHQGNTEVMREDGTTELIPTGGMAIGHAHPSEGQEETIEHYNDILASLLNARSYEDEIGGYFRGSLVAGATYADVALVEAAATSGHWGYVHGYTTPTGKKVRSGWQCFGPCAVVRPAAPLVREYREIAASLGGVGGFIGEVIEMQTGEDLKQPEIKPPPACETCMENEEDVTANLSASDQESILSRLTAIEDKLGVVERQVAEKIVKSVRIPSLEESINS
jgi:hypothetical protein